MGGVKEEGEGVSMLTSGVAELNVIGVARRDIVGIEHERANAIFELSWDVIVLVGSQGRLGTLLRESVGVVGGGIGDLAVLL